MSPLTFGWNEFRKALYVSQVLSAPTNQTYLKEKLLHIYIYIYIMS